MRAMPPVPFGFEPPSGDARAMCWAFVVFLAIQVVAGIRAIGMTEPVRLGLTLVSWAAVLGGFWSAARDVVPPRRRVRLRGVALVATALLVATQTLFEEGARGAAAWTSAALVCAGSILALLCLQVLLLSRREGSLARSAGRAVVAYVGLMGVLFGTAATLPWLGEHPDPRVFYLLAAPVVLMPAVAGWVAVLLWHLAYGARPERLWLHVPLGAIVVPLVLFVPRYWLG